MSDKLTAGMSAIRQFIGDAPTPERQLMAAKCAGLLAGYDARWAGSPYQVRAVEKFITSELWNPESQRKSRSFTVAGIEDALLGLGDMAVLMDHKTTSDDITDPNGSYWRQLVVEGQVSHYMLLEWLNSSKVDMAVWDVVHKPTIAPKNISAKRDIAEIRASGGYFGRHVSQDSLDALDAEPRETFEMYEARLAYDCTTERPQWYFQRRSVPRLDSEIHEYATELWEHSQEILHVRRTNRHSRNSGACMLYGSPCKFLGICSGQDTPESDNWRKAKSVHPELSVMDDRREILTNSRIRCFQTCRRKHFYQYELGIERQDEEEKESLYFGRLWHKALEAWFAFDLEKETEHVNSTGSSANSVETADTI